MNEKELKRILEVIEEANKGKRIVNDILDSIIKHSSHKIKNIYDYDETYHEFHYEYANGLFKCFCYENYDDGNVDYDYSYTLVISLDEFLNPEATIKGLIEEVHGIAREKMENEERAVELAEELSIQGKKKRDLKTLARLKKEYPEEA